MPIIKSAIKKMRQDVKRTAANSLKKLRLKQTLKSVAKKSTKKSNVGEAYKAIDKASKAGIIHKNKASRMKSAIAKKSIK